MKKLYILTLSIFFATIGLAKEKVFEFNGYDNTGNTLTATTANVNDATLTASTLSRNDINVTKVNTSYSDGKLTITGINTISNIAIYNLLGRKVIDLKNISINGTFSKYLDLPRNNIYIVKISSATFSKTFKIVAK
jgi:hypothetical protein